MKKIMIALVLVTAPLRGATWTVINTNDAGAGSLRDAITNANADAAPAPIIDFAIPGAAPHVITLTSADLPSLTHANTTVDGTTQQVSPGVPAVFVDGAGAFTIFTIAGDGCTITTMGIFGSSFAGIAIDASNTTILGCFIGTDTTGTAPAANVVAIYIAPSTPVAGTIIGGLSGGIFDSTKRNVISGNSVDNIFMTATAPNTITNTTIEGNYIGTNASGTAAVVMPGVFANCDIEGDISGILISKNVIAGDGTSPADGIFLFSGVTDVHIVGNKIGTNAAGNTALGNSQGIEIRGTAAVSGIVIGGPDATNDRNVISGNTNEGILINGNGNGTIVRNNFIGTDLAGTAPLPNGVQGIEIDGPNDAVQIIDNVVSGNTNNGILLLGASAPVTNTTITGNKIGVDISGSFAIPNGLEGILMQASTGNAIDGTIIGGVTPALANTISGNTSIGIALTTGVVNSIIQGNFIGTNDVGNSIGNGLQGILLIGTAGNESFNNTVGGIGNGTGNVVTFNGSFGVLVNGNGTDSSVLNPILGNSIFNNGNNNGIDLQAGGNHEQPAPVVGNAVLSADFMQLTVTVAAPTTPAASTFRIELFINDVNRNPITEGQTFIGAFDSVASGATATQTFTLAAPTTTSKFVSATATNQNNPVINADEGDTSEFSDNIQITQAGPTPPVVSGPISCISQAILDKYCA